MHRRALPPVLPLLLAATLGGCAGAPAPKLSFAELYARDPAAAASGPARPQPPPGAPAAAPGPPAARGPASLLPAGGLRSALAGLPDPRASAAGAAPAARALQAHLPALDWPVAPVAVTSFFGRRQHPVTGELRAHRGLDLAAREGQLVATAGGGRVVRAGWRGGYGLQVEVVHAGGVHSRYGHLSRILVKRGALLEPGDVVGLAGNTGLSTGAHLHFELWRAGQALDPMRVLGPGGVRSGAQTREGRRPSGRRPR